MPNLNTLAENARQTCQTVRPVPGHGPLLDAIAHLGGPDLTPRASRGGWYRPGRILDADNQVIAEDALAWLEQAWSDAEENIDLMMETISRTPCIITRVTGITHYFVAPYGDRPTEFIQLEVEELQEVKSHAFDELPAEIESIESMLESPAGITSTPLGKSHYAFRRVADIAEQTGRMGATSASPPPLLRFLDEWSASSAGRQRHFSDHWVLSLSEHLDRFRQPRVSASPFAAHPLRWTGAETLEKLELAQALHQYDQTTGYGFSWYFQMVSGYKVPRSLAPRVHADLISNMAYLPERDAAIIAQWVAEPYSV